MKVTVIVMMCGSLCIIERGSEGERKGGGGGGGGEKVEKEGREREKVERGKKEYVCVHGK